MRLKINYQFFDTHFGNVRAINEEVSDLLNRFRFIGIAPGTELFTEVKDNEEDVKWVEDIKDTPEGIEFTKAMEEINKDADSLICSKCGFVAKHAGALGGHIRFKHKR